MAGFVWGGNTGEKLTPKEVERQRLAAALMARDAGMTTPVASPWAGVNRALQGYLSGRDKRNAGAAETAGMAGADAYVRDNPVLSGLLGGGTMPQSSPVGISTSGVPVGGDGLPASLVRTESGGNWNALNSEGYGGRGQFGTERLADAARAGIIPAGMTGAEYSQQPEAVQLAVENWHKNDILGNLGKYVGTDIDGAGPIPPLTEDSILAVAHLGGTGGAKKFIESGGAYNPADSNGTSLADYAMTHSGGGGMSASGQPIPITGGGSNVVGALASAMSDPWVAEKYGPVLQAMMTQQMGRGDMQYQQQLAQSDPMYQAQLAQLTAPKAADPFANTKMVGDSLIAPDGQGGFTPVYTPPAGQGFAQLTPDQVAAAGLPPGAYQRGPDNKIYEIGGGGVSVTVGGAPEIGKLSTDYAYLTDQAGNPIIDPLTNLPKAAPVPGSPAAIEAERLRQKTIMADNQKTASGDIVSTDIDRAIKLIDKPGMLPTTGFGADLAAKMGGTNANDLRNLLNTVKANAAFDSLAAMRAASPTGGALGSIAVQELTLLEAAKGALEQSQTPQQLKDNLIRLQNITLDIIHGPGAGPARKKTSYDSPTEQAAPPTDIPPAPEGFDPARWPDVWKVMPEEDKALFK